MFVPVSTIYNQHAIFNSRFNYGIIIDTDIEDENMQKELVDIVQVIVKLFKNCVLCIRGHTQTT